jgi:hypothetical protein
MEHPVKATMVVLDQLPALVSEAVAAEVHLQSVAMDQALTAAMVAMDQVIPILVRQ